MQESAVSNNVCFLQTAVKFSEESKLKEFEGGGERGNTSLWHWYRRKFDGRGLNTITVSIFVRQKREQETSSYWEREKGEQNREWFMKLLRIGLGFSIGFVQMF